MDTNNPGTGGSELRLGPLSVLSTVAAGLLLITFIANAFFGRKRLPGPWLSVPILGDTFELLSTDPGRMLFKRFKCYGRVFRLRLLGFEAYVVADPEALRPLLADDGANFWMPMQSFNWLMGKAKVLAKKQTHVPWRKLHLAALSGDGLKVLLPAVRRIMENHILQWTTQGRLEMFEEARVMGLDLAVSAITGVDLEATSLDLNWFKEQMSLFLAGLYGMPFALPGGTLAKGLAAKERLLVALMPLMQERHNAFGVEWEAAGRDPSKMAAKILNSGESVNVHKAQLVGFHSTGADSLRDTARTVLHSVMSAADTTRFALFNTWALLAQLPDIQDKLFEEQRRVVQDLGPEVSSQALNEMSYLDATFKEAQRILPASTGGFRKLTRDATIAGVTLPEGTVVWYHAYLLHILDPALWDGNTNCEIPAYMDWKHNLAGAFKPERWLGDETKRPRSFYVFGSGTHLCVGMKLVQMEVKLLLAMVIRGHRLALETPDMLLHAEQLFPFVRPAKGTDGMRLLPRKEPLPWN